eukprot:172567-Hanusia_phi.AAC.6
MDHPCFSTSTPPAMLEALEVFESGREDVKYKPIPFWLRLYHSLFKQSKKVDRNGRLGYEALCLVGVEASSLIVVDIFGGKDL